MSQIFKCNLLKYRLVFCSISPALQFFEKQVSVRECQRRSDLQTCWECQSEEVRGLTIVSPIFVQKLKQICSNCFLVQCFNRFLVQFFNCLLVQFSQHVTADFPCWWAWKRERRVVEQELKLKSAPFDPPWSSRSHSSDPQFTALRQTFFLLRSGKFLPSFCNFLALHNGKICVKNPETYWHD